MMGVFPNVKGFHCETQAPRLSIDIVYPLRSFTYEESLTKVLVLHVVFFKAFSICLNVLFDIIQVIYLAHTSVNSFQPC